MLKPPRFAQRLGTQPVGFFVADELVLFGIVVELAA